MQDNTQIFFGAWGFLLIDDILYLVRNCHVRKLLWNMSYFFQQIFLFIFFNCYCFFFSFFLQNGENLWGFIFFIFKYVLKNRKLEIIILVRKKPNNAKTKNTLSKPTIKNITFLGFQLFLVWCFCSVKIAFLDVFFWFWRQYQCLYLAPFCLAKIENNPLKSKFWQM